MDLGDPVPRVRMMWGWRYLRQKEYNKKGGTKKKKKGREKKKKKDEIPPTNVMQCGGVWCGPSVQRSFLPVRQARPRPPCNVCLLPSLLGLAHGPHRWSAGVAALHIQPLIACRDQPARMRWHLRAPWRPHTCPTPCSFALAVVASLLRRYLWRQPALISIIKGHTMVLLRFLQY